MSKDYPSATINNVVPLGGTVAVQPPIGSAANQPPPRFSAPDQIRNGVIGVSQGRVEGAGVFIPGVLYALQPGTPSIMADGRRAVWVVAAAAVAGNVTGTINATTGVFTAGAGPATTISPIVAGGGGWAYEP